MAKAELTPNKMTTNQLIQLISWRRDMKILAEQNSLKTTPKVGPRNKLLHYIKDLNMPVYEAMQKVKQEWPSYTEEIMQKWIDETKKSTLHRNFDGR